MKYEIISTVQNPGESVYEDSIKIFTPKHFPLCIGVFDGRRTWKESGNADQMVKERQAQSTGQLAARFATEQMALCHEEDPFWVMKGINGFWGVQLMQYNYDLQKPEGLPGCTATIVQIRENRMISFAHACDTKIILFNDAGEFLIPTIDYMYSYDQKVFQLAVQNAKELGTTPRKAIWETDYTVHHQLRDPKEQDYFHRRLENVSLAAGIEVLNGMASAGNFFQTGNLPLGKFQFILIATDGLSFLAPIGTLPPWEEMVTFLLQANLNLDILAKEIRRMEDEDPEFEKYPRFAHHRDATGVLIQL